MFAKSAHVLPVGLLPFTYADHAFRDSLVLRDRIPRLLSACCPDETLSIIPFDSVLEVMADWGDATDELSEDHLGQIARALGVRVLITGIIDSFAMQAMSPRPLLKLPHARMVFSIRIRYFDAGQNGYCRGSTVLNADGYRTQHALEKIATGMAPELDGPVPPVLMQDAATEALEELGGKFCREVPAFLKRIRAVGVYPDE